MAKKRPKKKRTFSNPFRPGAGHKPPYLAGREQEIEEFRRLLRQDVILENLVLTGLRGVGKTVLLDELKPIAINEGWLWVGTDLSEAASLSEERIAIRLLTDLAAVTSSLVIDQRVQDGVGFKSEQTTVETRMDYQFLQAIFERTPGLVSDKLKNVLEIVWKCIRLTKGKGIIFAYDEAQNLSDHSLKDEYPLSLMLDVFQSLQKKEITFMLVLVGLPMLFPKLVEARTFAERTFHVVFLDKLNNTASRDAIVKPIDKAGCPLPLSKDLIQEIIVESGGYPYFIQFLCREVYDVALQKFDLGQPLFISIPDITHKLDTDFFAGRWARATDRQRDLLQVIASLENCEDEFTVLEIVEGSQTHLDKPFSASHVSQMLSILATAGLVYKNRYGKYSFAVPLLGRFISRQPSE